MTHVEHQTRFQVKRHDNGVRRFFQRKQEKMEMKNNGSHGDNSERKEDSEEILMNYLNVCKYYSLRDWFEEQKTKGIEIDDMCDAINLALAAGRTAYAVEAKRRDPTCRPRITGVVIDDGNGYFRYYSVDPGTRQYASAIVHVGPLYPPRPGIVLLSYPDDVKDPNAQEVKNVLPAFRVIMCQVVDLISGVTVCRYEEEDVDSNLLYRPTDGDLTELIKEAEERRKAQESLNRKAGAQRAAETRRRNKAEKRKREEEEGIIIKEEPKVKKQRIKKESVLLTIE